MSYSIKKFKSFVGMEGYGFNLDLMCNGKKVALVIDSAQGGDFDYHWENDKVRKEFYDFLKTQPQYEFMGEMSDMNDDVFVNNLVEEMENAKLPKKFEASMRKFIKKGFVVYTRKGDPEFSYYNLKPTRGTPTPAWTAGGIKLTKERYPDATIWNEVYQ